jgi:hypothetical protein
MLSKRRWWGGKLAISGSIHVAGPTNVARRAFLSVWPAKNVIAVIDSGTGSNPNYFFNGLKALSGPESYCVDVHSIDQSTAAAVLDNLTPV